MGSPRYRIIQWATGNTGQRALREVIRDPLFELVGVRVYSNEKDGVNAGELCGESKTGILATTDRDAILELEADCCVYMPRATGRGKSRAGLSVDELVEDLVALLSKGTNVVSTCTDLFARGIRLSEEHRGRILDACHKGNASVWTTGSDPGFITETVPLALLSVQRHVDLIEIEEFGDLSRRPSAHMVMEQMRFGKPLDPAVTEHRANHLFYEYKFPLMILADYAGFNIDEWVPHGEMAAAAHDVEIVAGTIKKGTAAAHKIVVTGRENGVDRLRFIQYGYTTRETDPGWNMRATGWHLRVDSDAPFDIDMPLPVSQDDLANCVAAYNSNGPVNAIPYVCAAAPGILATEDLPHILSRGPRRAVRW